MDQVHSNNSSKILFGIVLYKNYLNQSKSLTSLVLSSAFLPENKADIVIYDNSEADFNFSTVNKSLANECGYHYFNNPHNPGLSKAYNYFLRYGKEHGYKWLVILDQDTMLPEGFVKIYKEYASQNNDLQKILIPIVKTRSTTLSPSKFYLGRNFLINNPPSGKISFKNLVFINSGLMVEIDFGLNLNGFDEQLKLDFVDTEFCLRAKTQLKHIFILPIIIQQSFSHHEDNFESAKKRYKIYTTDLKTLQSIRPKECFSLNINQFLHKLKLCYKYHTLYFLVH